MTKHISVLFPIDRSGYWLHEGALRLITTTCFKIVNENCLHYNFHAYEWTGR